MASKQPQKIPSGTGPGIGCSAPRDTGPPDSNVAHRPAARSSLRTEMNKPNQIKGRYVYAQTEVRAQRRAEKVGRGDGRPRHSGDRHCEERRAKAHRPEDSPE